jgi:hypothetical protein
MFGGDGGGPFSSCRGQTESGASIFEFECPMCRMSDKLALDIRYGHYKR